MPIDPPGESPGILGSAGQFDDTLCSREDIDVDEISSAILSEAGKLILCTNGQNNDKNQEIVTDEKNGEAGGANTLPRLQEPTASICPPSFDVTATYATYDQLLTSANAHASTNNFIF